MAIIFVDANLHANLRFCSMCPLLSVIDIRYAFKILSLCALITYLIHTDSVTKLNAISVVKYYLKLAVHSETLSNLLR